MIVNNQMGGEGMWFWYTTAFHNGAKLYSQLHIPLQPLNVLLIEAWMHISGKRLIPWELLSYLPIGGLCASFYLILRESDWPEWQKGIILLGSFVLTVFGHSYRFDDYHVYAEVFIFLALACLLVIQRAQTARTQTVCSILLGVLCAVTWTMRVTDGAALIATCLLVLPFLIDKRLFFSYALLIVTLTCTVLVIVALTGDSFHDYIFSTLIHAAGSKGGSGSILAAPFKSPGNALNIMHMNKKPPALLLFVLALGPIVCRFSKTLGRYIVAIDIVALLLGFCVIGHKMKVDFLKGSFITSTILILPFVMYALPVVVLARFVKSKVDGKPWNSREILVILPLAEWCSYAAGAAAEPITNYYAPIAMLLLLIVVLIPERQGPSWLKPHFTAYLAMLAVLGIVGKVLVPYSWQNYKYGSMFVGRQVYVHPVYGWMYIDKDLLHFSEQVCTDIGAKPGLNAPELLSLPYPFPNYFCATPPWQNYVQTFFDTTPKTTIDRLMHDLDTAPPQYIVYQRQLNIMIGSERLYNHGQRLPQREMDDMIFGKISSGQWKLIDTSDYLDEPGAFGPGEAGWYIIRTRQ